MSLVTVSLSHYNISGKGPRISERHINILKNEAEKLSLFKFTKHKSFKYWNAKDKYVFTGQILFITTENIWLVE
jgi:hypothetical protein